RRPSRPKIPLNLVLGVFFGLTVAVGAAFGREYFDTSVKSSDDLEVLLHLPTLAAIPNFRLAGAASGPRGRAPRDAPDELPVVREPWSRVAEAFRSMRTAVLFSTSSTPPKVILITSATAAEGKT